MSSPSTSSSQTNDSTIDNDASRPTLLVGFWARLWLVITQHPKSIATIIYEPTPFKLNALNIY